MTLAGFVMLAAFVTLAGVGVVTFVAVLVSRLDVTRSVFAVGCLLVYATVLTLRPASWVAIDVAVLLGAIGGVILVERSLGSTAAVVTFLMVAAVVDVISITGGPTRILIDQYRSGNGDLLLYLTLVVPVNTQAIPVVGIGDLFIGGGAATALLRCGHRARTVASAIALGLLTALGYGLWRGGAPAIPFIAVSTGLLVWHASRLSDRRIPPILTTYDPTTRA